jgi:hypothetical protein
VGEEPGLVLSNRVQAGPSLGSFPAEHDLRLLGVQLEAEYPEPGGNRVPQRAGLILRVAVRDNVIRLCRPLDYADRGVKVLVGGGRLVELVGIIRGCLGQRLSRNASRVSGGR